MTRFGWVMTTYFAGLRIGLTTLFHPVPKLICNASASIPIGLYAVHPTGTLHVTELLVVTDNGYGKRTDIEEYPRKGRGAMGVKTASLTEKKGGLAGALIVREHQELVFISQHGMVQRTAGRGISKQGRPAQGVRVMNLREDDQVSAVALVIEQSAATAAIVEEGPEDGPEELSADGSAMPEDDA